MTQKGLDNLGNDVNQIEANNGVNGIGRSEQSQLEDLFDYADKGVENVEDQVKEIKDQLEKERKEQERKEREKEEGQKNEGETQEKRLPSVLDKDVDEPKNSDKEEKYPEGQPTLADLLKNILDNLKVDDLGISKEKLAEFNILAQEVMEASATNLDESKIKEFSRAESIAHELQTVSAKFNADAAAIKEYAQGVGQSDNKEINHYAQLVKEEMNTRNSTVEVAFGNVVGNTIAAKFIDSIVDEIANPEKE